MKRPGLYTLALLSAAGGCRNDDESPTAPRAEPAATVSAATPTFLQLSAGGGHTCGVSTDNEAYCWGQDVKEQLGNGMETGGGAVPSLVLGGFQFRQVSAGTYHTCGVTVDDEPYCWGFNGSGQLGTGIRDNSSTPVFGDFGRSFSEGSVGQDHTCGVQDPILMCWGSNAYGQLGQGDRANRLAPEQISSVDFCCFRQVSAGAFHTCAVTTDDRALCWGRNYRGVLGIDGFRRLRPTLVGGGLKFRQVAAGVWHTCGVTTDNLAYCWGWNNYGDVSPRHGFHTCGLTPAHVAYCWGANGFGQLGNPMEGFSRVPVAVGGPI